MLQTSAGGVLSSEDALGARSSGIHRDLLQLWQAGRVTLDSFGQRLALTGRHV